MKIIHISDTHNSHQKLKLEPCELLLFTGDIGRRTTPKELLDFLEWFKDQKADFKVFIAGNHDINLDKNYIKNIEKTNIFEVLKFNQDYEECKRLIQVYKQYNIHYLENNSIIYKDYKIYGSPYSPSFHKHYWAFNKDRGKEIYNEWIKIPKDTDILLTHSPVYNILDDVKEQKKENELDSHAGCKDLFKVIKERLTKIKLHCSGHLHNNYGAILQDVSNTRKVLFSNGAVVNNRNSLIIEKPIIINI